METRQALVNTGNGNLTLLAPIFPLWHEDSGGPEPAYQDSDRTEVESGMNTASSDAEIPSDGQEISPLPQLSSTQSRIPTPTVQRGLVRVLCYFKVQPASFIVRRLNFGQFQPHCPYRAQMDAIWFIVSNVERVLLQMQ